MNHKELSRAFLLATGAFVIFGLGMGTGAYLFSYNTQENRPQLPTPNIGSVPASATPAGTPLPQAAPSSSQPATNPTSESATDLLTRKIKTGEQFTVAEINALIENCLVSQVFFGHTTTNVVFKNGQYVHMQFVKKDVQNAFNEASMKGCPVSAVIE